MADDDLHDFERISFGHDGKERTVFRRGTGPAVIVISEMPGISPKVADLARRISDIGCTAVMPHLFGVPGRDPNPESAGTFGAVRYMLSSIVPACISREFATFALGRTSPVVAWLRALAAVEHERCGGPGVGAVGMCFTGGFALAMAVDDRMLVPVLSQPSMPMSIGKKRQHTIDISSADLDQVKHRCANDGLEVLGLRFASDRFVPDERFAFLREQLGDAFVAVELSDADANPEAVTKPHSVLTEHLIDEVGTRTRQTLDEVLELFRRKLLV
ncbi:MAG: dienelactone hydrolase [Acidimicrobiia bacterium]|nr:dienelactone hydrolase [Acidimicrobiia bacterium]